MFYTAALIVAALACFTQPVTARIGGILLLAEGAAVLSFVMAGRNIWEAYAVIHLVSAAWILRDPANRLSAMIGTTFVMSLMADIGFGLASSHSRLVEYILGPSRGGASILAYIETLQAIAWLQLILVGGFYVSGGVRRGIDYLLPRRRSINRPAHHSGVEPWQG